MIPIRQTGINSTKIGKLVELTYGVAALSLEGSWLSGGAHLARAHLCV